MQKILGKEFKEFWLSICDSDKKALIEWYDITLKDGAVFSDETELGVHDIEDSAVITKVFGEAIVNGERTEISTLYKRWKEDQTSRNYLVKVDTGDAEALMKLIIDSGLKVSVEVV